MTVFGGCFLGHFGIGTIRPLVAAGKALITLRAYVAESWRWGPGSLGERTLI